MVLTTFDADQYVLRALRAGVAGFLVKSTPPEDLIKLVQVAAEGHTVLAVLGPGLSNAEIGARLYLSEATVKGYVSRILVKLDPRTVRSARQHHARIGTSIWLASGKCRARTAWACSRAAARSAGLAVMTPL